MHGSILLYPIFDERGRRLCPFFLKNLENDKNLLQHLFLSVSVCYSNEVEGCLLKIFKQTKEHFNHSIFVTRIALKT